MSLIELDLPGLGTQGVPRLGPGEQQSRKDYTSDQEVRWCPGCGDYAILAAVQGFLPELGLKRENIVFISGIGCSSRFPYYLNTYGMHSIHGRAPTIATGLAVARPDLSVWVVTGDGDALSIGGNHIIHALRKNVNIKILMFNNRIYGLTKGQYSPTSPSGTVTKSTPLGSLEHPFNPTALALGAEATFVARTMASDRQHIHDTLKAAAEHRGSAFVEIYQNCPIFNDGAFDVLKDSRAATRVLHLKHGEPIMTETGYVVVRDFSPSSDGFELVPVETAKDINIVRHNAHGEDSSWAYAIARRSTEDMRFVPMGVFRQISRPTFDDQVRAQVAGAVTGAGGPAQDRDLLNLLRGKDTWTVT